jgi:hypothetical protein
MRRLLTIAVALTLSGCLDIPNTQEIVTECEAAAERARAEATAECVALVQDQVEAGRAWLEELARSFGCVQTIDPIDGPTAEWDCSAVCERAPDTIYIP